MASLYTNTILSKDIELKFVELNNINLDNFEDLLHDYVVNKIKAEVEEKCIEDGYVKKDSVKLLTLSCGLYSADKIKYTASYECLICLPVEGMPIKCVAMSNTNGGVRAVIANEEISPIVVFVSRDITDEDLSKYKEGDVFDATVFGVQYELNDTFISVLAIPS
jgi:hypothetical protein